MTLEYSNGYYAGLVNDRECPHKMFSLAWLHWHLGNSFGVDVHCAMVEAVYLKETES